MQTKSRVATGHVNHQSRLYTLLEFIKPDCALLLSHADESSRIWHERFEHLNFRYMKQLRNKILVTLPNTWRVCVASHIMKLCQCHAS
jgi:hypothetical protein